MGEYGEYGAQRRVAHLNREERRDGSLSNDVLMNGRRHPGIVYECTTGPLLLIISRSSVSQSGSGGHILTPSLSTRSPTDGEEDRGHMQTLDEGRSRVH
jgi:hypothetical protein